jgi:arylsulfatase A-like enzyme
VKATLFVFAVLAVVNPAGAADQPARKPNIVFILADDLGYGDLGCYGQKRIQTPNLDRMASEGLRFTQFYAGSTVCAPSRCALMTGLHTGHCLIRGNARENLRPEDVTVARVFKDAGYTTGLVGKWGLGHEGSTGVPTKQGFDYFYGYLDQVHAHNYYPSFLMRNEERVPLKNVVPGPGEFGKGVATTKAEYSGDLLAAEAVAFIDRNKDRPFFLYFAPTIPHANNEAGKQGMEVPDYGIYKDKDWPDPQKGHAAMITRLDADIGRLFAGLKKHGIDENTLVIFTSDNGPHREGGNDPDFNRSHGPLRGIKRDLYEGGIRVPMIARWPGRIAAGTTTDCVAAFWDVMPTLADLAGAKTPSGIDGQSFVPTLRGDKDKQAQHESLYWAFYERGGARAVRAGKWKAVEQPMYTPIRLYDLDMDLGEKDDVAAKHPDVVARLRKIMDESNTPSARWKFPEKK